MRGRKRAGLGAMTLALSLAARGAPCQQVAPVAWPKASSAKERPGRFKIGPFYLTPTVRIGQVGLDTNVFYTPTDRQTDVSASGGPGLDLVLPMGRARLVTGGTVDYVYFARTASQRKLAGNARGGLEWSGNRLQAKVQETFTRTFQRPSFEVDRRVLQDQWTTNGELTVRTVGRLGVRTAVSSARIDVSGNQTFLGTDLRDTLSRDEHQALLGLRYGLTPKTFLVVEGDYQIDRFLIDERRDADSNRLYGGFEIESETRLSGKAVGGARFFRPRDPSRTDIRVPYAAVDLAYRFGPRTRLQATYARDLAYSAFDTSGATPTLTNESFGARLEKGLWGRVELYLWGREVRFRTDGSITVKTGAGDTITAVRRDAAREAGADLGYRFRSSLRIGVAAVYTNRRSTIADFGIQGLLVGGTVTYNPKSPF